MALVGRVLLFCELNKYLHRKSVFNWKTFRTVYDVRCSERRLKSTWTGHSGREENSDGSSQSADIHGPFGQPFYSTHPHLMSPGEVTPGITADELHARRCRLMEQVTSQSPWPGCHHVLLLPAARVGCLSEDIPLPFRQSSDLLYLSGCQEPDSLLLLHTGPRRAAPAHTSLLFVAADTPQQRLWEGGRTGPAAAAALHGVDQALSSAELCRYMECLARELGRAAVWYDFHADLSTPLNATVRDFLGTCAGSRLESPRRLIQSQRLIKSPAEQRLMRASARLASAAVRDTMCATRPGCGEHQLAAMLEYQMRRRGAQRAAYPSVVAGAARSNTIHYTRNDQLLAAGDHVLVDAGCELNGYCSDVSRVWPVSGRFSDAQLQLYSCLLDIQQQLLDVVHNSRPTLDALYACMLRLLAERLAALGILGSLSRQRSQQFQSVQRYCPHHVGHYLGMDVHDTSLMPKNVRLRPGMCITVEPGLYIPADDTDCPEQFRGLGLRIEDDVLITEQGSDVITADCPKTVQHIYDCMEQQQQ